MEKSQKTSTHNKNQQLLVFKYFQRNIDIPELKLLIKKFTYGKSIKEIRKINKVLDDFNYSMDNYKEPFIIYCMYVMNRENSYIGQILNELLNTDNNLFEKAEAHFDELNSLLKEMGLLELELNNKFLDRFNDIKQEHQPIVS